ncbi:MAG: lipocalin family protein [Rubrivivax sp.]|nr:lipocalin family protein [Rubrivivax sp.]
MSTPSLASLFAAIAAALALIPGAASAQSPTPETAPLQSLPALTLSTYQGTWYQVALFPNRFQSQCLSDTTATYRALPGDRIEVINRCRKADGQMDDAVGQARPVGKVEADQLKPAQLQVSFLPGWLQWLPIRGDYWVVQRAEDGRYAVVSEPSRRFLWVLSRTPSLSGEDESAIRSQLIQQGFDLQRWTAHPHQPSTRAAPAATPAPRS